MSFRTVLKELEENGLLLLSDKSLPSVVGIVGGGKVKGSWWGSAKGHEIFRDLERLESEPDNMKTRLVSGKVTYLHRRLWPEFLTIATSREEWQTSGLSNSATKLLSLVQKEGEIRLDRVNIGRNQRSAAQEIEKALLVYSEEIHTESGAHAKVLMTWSRYPKIRDQRIAKRGTSESKKKFEGLLNDLNKKYGARGALPWQ